jgi:hypothetical protein
MANPQGKRLPHRTRQHGRVARARRRRCGARRRSAPSTISDLAAGRCRAAFIRALALIKAAAALVNGHLGLPRARRRDRRKAATRSPAARMRTVPDRPLPDRLRHLQQHECQRGDRPREPRPHRSGDPPQRPRQPGPEQQRRDPDRDAGDGVLGRQAACCRRCATCARPSTSARKRSARSSRPAAPI